MTGLVKAFEPEYDPDLPTAGTPWVEMGRPEEEGKMRYTYSFSVWPSETWGFTRALFDFFRVINTQAEMVFTEEQFEQFRSALSHDGFTLREIERWPYVEPEPVF